MYRIHRGAILIGASALFMFRGTGVVAGPSASDSFLKFVNEKVADYQKNGTPGVAVVYLTSAGGTKNEGFVFSGTSGWKGSHDTITGATVFEIGSITKVFVATLGEIALAHTGTPLTSPVGPILALYGGATPSPTFNRITFGQLATHTAGLPMNGVSEHPSAELYGDEPPGPQILDFWNTWPASAAPRPGRCWQYSNSGFVTLGFAASQMLAPGNSSQFIKQLQINVTDPLHMYCTAAAESAIPCTSFAKGTKLLAGGKTKNVETQASDLKTDAVDMSYWLEAQLGISDPARAPTPALTSAISSTQVVQFRNKNVCGTTGTRSMALGWGVAPLDGEHPTDDLYEKNGATSLGGMSAAVTFALQHHAAIAVLTNAVGGRASEAEAEDDDGGDESGTGDDATPKGPQGLANLLLRKWIELGLK